EIEDVALGQAHVLQKLPGGVRQPLRLRGSKLRRDPFDHGVETHVRVFPVQQPREQIAKIFDRVHLASLRSSRKDTPHTRTLCSMSDLIYSARPMLGSAANESRRCHERTSEGPERSEG